MRQCPHGNDINDCEQCWPWLEQFQLVNDTGDNEVWEDLKALEDLNLKALDDLVQALEDPKVWEDLKALEDLNLKVLEDLVQALEDPKVWEDLKALEDPKVLEDLAQAKNGIKRASVPGEVKKMTIDVKELYGETAKLDLLPEYVRKAKEQAGEGQDVVLTGAAPVWLYLAVAHALHGVARKLVYESPVTGPVVIFDHNPF